MHVEDTHLHGHMVAWKILLAKFALQCFLEATSMVPNPGASCNSGNLGWVHLGYYVRGATSLDDMGPS